MNFALPIEGICSFGKYPICTDTHALDADIAVLGVPSDVGVGFLSGCRLGPRRIREASTQYGRGDVGFYDPERDDVYLAAPLKIVDCGDVHLIQGDLDRSLDNIAEHVRRIAASGAIPAVMGGDHSISIGVGRGLDRFDGLTVIQLDAHLDWTDSREGQRHGNGSPMRRMSEMNHIGNMVQVGLRGMGSSGKQDYDDARSYGSRLITAREFKERRIEEILGQIPDFEHAYVTIDIDVLDISIASGTGSPMPGGLDYDQLQLILEGIAKKGAVVAFDMVEVAPQYDPTNSTTRIAALTMLNFMAHILKAREIAA
ncbi:agmatinase [Salinicola rhizosphaerae]|uniref:SpeB arginase/agmatinase/formimionoglutamate hydrolase SpeB n=1 Tax=Salinicola rhizosphaerae TaxID=1443141 RepID=A0ABQ3E5H6_9GAMM|nr:agmatinase [Salinicola rhizosphaerae]GHB25730.1 SpeB arginase/agmatinase/formimionoglutamate hydrolase SpeB [Salinicola rhizosphaerae]